MQQSFKASAKGGPSYALFVLLVPCEGAVVAGDEK